VIGEAAVPRFAPGMRLRQDAARDNRWVVLGPERMFVPDEIALEILRLIDGARSLGAIADDLATRFQAPRAEIAADVTALLDELAAKGVIVT
jgi:pyrroloquinoline quinone biosynthesis protein D